MLSLHVAARVFVADSAYQHVLESRMWVLPKDTGLKLMQELT